MYGKIGIVLAFSLFLLAALSVPKLGLSQDEGKKVRVGYVNISEVLRNSRRVTAVEFELDSMKFEHLKKTDRIDGELAKMFEEALKNGKFTEEYKAAVREAMSVARILDKTGKEFEEKHDRLRKERWGRLYADIQAAAEELRTELGLDMIVKAREYPRYNIYTKGELFEYLDSNTVMSYGREADLTHELIARIDKR
ncbi:MAG: OmpH/Skp family outer membrane protein [Planctomycetota bacterium]|jgi:Skp family chaperone for outer membrane proteins